MKIPEGGGSLMSLSHIHHREKIEPGETFFHLTNNFDFKN
jgi:hypothetical protein